MFAVPQRNLVLFCDIFQGLLRIKYLDVSVAQPSWSSVVTLSAPIEIEEFWESGLWCEDNNRILIGNVKNDDNAIYEISIPPTNISSTAWSVERVPLTAGDRIGWAMDPGNFQKWRYNSKIKAVVYMPYANTYGDDSVFVYRPRNVDPIATNVNELKKKKETISFTTAPNPFSSATTITITSGASLKNTTLQVFNMQGKLVADLSNQLKEKTVLFDAEGLSEGLYVIRLNSDNETFTRKITYLVNP